MRVEEFDYALPEGRAAQQPASPRDAARLMVHRIGVDESEHHTVAELDQALAPGDLVIVNDTRVRCARLLGRRVSGGAVELLLLAREGERAWRALAKPGGRLRPGERIELEGGALYATLLARRRELDGGPAPEWILELEVSSGAPIEQALERHGRMPLPPYIRRGRGEDPWRETDRASYQTVFARERGGVAAPTAGLHFTRELLERLEARGVERAALTLHVGEGTFRPVRAEHTADHVMHPEEFVLPEGTVAAIELCRTRGRRVVAVGTTVVRVLESCADVDGRVRAGAGTTQLFLQPGAAFRVVDALLTNFHLPRSTLLMLVCAFAGRERVLRLYSEAIERGYRFYSYGDAMLLLR